MGKLRRIGVGILAALGLWLGAASLAQAQVYPNIPPNTVLGRYGSNVPGQPQAIPIATLLQAITVNAVQVGGPLGAPSSGSLANVTGCAITTCVSGLGANVSAALGVATGNTGAFVLYNGALGTPASGSAANLTGLPLAGLNGLGTGVATALGINVGSAGAFVTFNGAGGTPSSLVLTNATGLPLTAGVTGILPVANGGIGVGTLATGKPLFGAGTAAITTGTLSGNTTEVATATGVLTNGHCVSIDASGNFIDAGGACTVGGGGGTVTAGTLNQLAYYSAAGTTVVGLNLGTGLSITGGTLNASGGVASVGAATGAILLGTGLTISSQTINTPWTISGSNITNNNAGTVTAGPMALSGVTGILSGTNSYIEATDSGNSRAVALETNQGGGLPAVGFTNGASLSQIIAASAVTEIYYSASANLGVGTAGQIQINNSFGTSGQCVQSAGASAAAAWAPCGQSYACNGTSDTSSINTLTASGIHYLRLSGTTCAVTTLATLPANFRLDGDTQAGTCITTSSTTGNVITMNTGGGDMVTNLCISSSVNRTSGAHIYATGGSVTIQNVLLYGFYNGIELNGVGSPGTSCPSPYNGPCFGAHISNIKAYGNSSGVTFSNDCLLADGTSGSNANPDNDAFIDDFNCSGVGTLSKIINGFEIVNAGEIHFTHGNFENISGANILVDPNGACSSGVGINWLEIGDSVFLDAAATYGLHVIATNGSCSQNIDIHDGWVANNQNGIWVETDTGNGTYIIEMKIHDEHIINQSNDGIHLANNANLGTTFITNNFVDQGGSGAAFFVGNGVNGWKIMNNSFTGGTYGGFFPTATLSSTLAIGNFFSATTPVAGSPAITLNAYNSPNIP